MKKYLLHIISLAAICTLLFACSDSIEPEAGKAKRAVTLSLSVSTRAIEIAEDASEGTHGTLKLWVFDADNEKALLYREYENVRWNREPAGEEQPEYFTSIIESLELEQENVKMSVHVVVNSESVNDDSGSSLRGALGEETGEEELENCIFRISDETQKCRGNELLIYGHQDVPETVLSPDNLFRMNVVAKRCLSRLEVYFTQNSVAANLKVKKITLAKRPATGILVPPAEGVELPGLGTENTEITIFENPGGEAIPAVLGSDVDIADFAKAYDEDQATFTPVVLAQPILTERKGIGDNGQNDNVQGTEDAYILTVTYDEWSADDRTLKENLTKRIALGHVPRNTRYRIFLRSSVRVPIEVYTSIIGWEYGKGVSDPFDVTDLDSSKW